MKRNSPSKLKTKNIFRKEILALAERLPSGKVDPDAKAKLLKEFVEFCNTPTEDRAALLLEAGDNLYYCVKAQYNRLITKRQATAHMREVTHLSGFSRAVIEAACIAKYKLRAAPGNPKNDAAERAAVAHLIEMV